MVPRLRISAPAFRTRAFRQGQVCIAQRRSYTAQDSNLDPEKPSVELSKAYLERLQATIQPRLTPVLLKVRAATDTLRTLPRDPKEAIQEAGVALNKLTGYDHIETVKRKVEQQAKAFEDSREQVQEAKKKYQEAIETRSNTQREINELLQRKHLWTGQDVTRFTELYRLEHEHSQAELMAKETYQQCEKQMDREYMNLARSIMERYHEEQLWSDKIRSVSTYGTWALMVVNLLLFVAVQTVFEPYKRKRLTDKFEELLIAKVEEEKGTFRQMLDDRDQAYQSQQVSVMSAVSDLAATVQSLHPPPSPAPSPPPSLPLQPVVESARPVTTVESENKSAIRRQDIIMYSVPGAIAGGLITAVAMFLWH